MQKARNFIFILLCVFVSDLAVAQVANVRTVTESFASVGNLDNAGGMVWNIGRGELHPPLQVEGWNDGAAQPPVAFSVGDGRHGAFVASRYALFDRDGVVSGGVIEINTDVWTDLQFTSFDLDAGYTLRPVGASPLIIRSQTTVIVDGVISCSGGDGADAVVDSTVSLSGGVARCGSADGGDSVPAGVAPGIGGVYDGTVGGAFVGAGRGGPVQLLTGGQGGGGGGAYIKNDTLDPADKPEPTDGDNSAGGAGGLAGAIYRDDAFQDAPVGTGSGGGGGSGYDNALDVPGHSSGGSGGAGGGSIFIYAVDGVTVGATGEVRADGGAGGAALGGFKGGGGGGGGGGSILIWSGGDIVFDGPVTASSGSGGISGGGDGGTGAWGRTWVVEVGGFAGGLVVEDPESRLNVPGQVRFETGVTYTVTSGAIDIGNTRPQLITADTTVANLGASTFVYDLAFSADSALSGLTGWALSSTYLNQEISRFVRFRIQVDNLDGVNPVRVQDVSWTYEGFEQTDFEFVTGCGSVGGLGRGGGGSGGLWLFVLCFPLLVLLGLRFGRRIRYF